LMYDRHFFEGEEVLCYHITKARVHFKATHRPN